MVNYLRDKANKITDKADKAKQLSLVDQLNKKVKDTAQYTEYLSNILKNITN